MHHKSVLGGAFIEDERKYWEFEVAYDECNTGCPTQCHGLEFKNVVVEENTAELAGGGLFLRSPKNLAIFFLDDADSHLQSAEQEPADEHVVIRNNAITVNPVESQSDVSVCTPRIAKGLRRSNRYGRVYARLRELP